VIKVDKDRQVAIILHPKSLGAGSDIKARVKAYDATLIAINGAITPIQQRNLEKIWNTKVIDRTGLILEIFARRAATKEGRLQVELARQIYERSRLVRTWTHLDQVKPKSRPIGECLRPRSGD